MTRHIVAIGPLPPPLHGLSLATSAMAALLADGNTVILQNLSPPASGWRLWRHPAKCASVISACIRLLRERRHPEKACYLACDGGFGQFYTLLLVISSRLLAYPTYLHHHSFRYIDRRSIVMRSILALSGPGLTHIFLCEIMRDRFTDAYRRRLRSAVISNAALVPPQAETEVDRARPLTIGMLSNLSRAKGLETFITLFRQARAQGLPLHAILAGPAADGRDRATIDAAIREFAGALEYRGAVLGDDKANVYADIDVFIFPTIYVNEAQPLVIFETKASGNAVIAYDRGCIRRQLDETDLLVPATGEFVEMAIAWLSEIPPDDPRGQRRRRVRLEYEFRHAKARERVKSLMP
ncbi:glycosyltransferase family 4 protein [Rhizobium sp. 18055]|uniref:glycosyltransferase family 4 protein n=1 Tax=Rhizobium sp. 18055 TaxID=2681403 RepID=UPI00135862B1|nr:glycosyltransferase family 4 protein [Rhizobium sp. 18055]